MHQTKAKQSTNRLQLRFKANMAYLLLLSVLVVIGITYFAQYKKSLPSVNSPSTQDLVKKEAESGHPEGLDKRVVIDLKALEEYLKTPLIELPSQEEIALHYTLLFMYCNKVMSTYNLHKAQAMRKILCHYKKYGMAEAKFLEAIDKGSIPGKFRRMPQESMHKHRKVYQADFDIEALIKIIGE